MTEMVVLVNEYTLIDTASINMKIKSVWFNLQMVIINSSTTQLKWFIQ